MLFRRFFLPNFLYNSICCGYPFELHRQVDAIQMGTRNICCYKEVDKKYTGCNLKTTKLLDCALIGVCAVIRSNTVVTCETNITPLLENCYILIMPIIPAYQTLSSMTSPLFCLFHWIFGTDKDK